MNGRGMKRNGRRIEYSAEMTSKQTAKQTDRVMTSGLGTDRLEARISLKNRYPVNRQDRKPSGSGFLTRMNVTGAVRSHQRVLGCHEATIRSAECEAALIS